jgi:hypothetical protein
MYRGIERPKCKAKLTTGEIVTYDVCSNPGSIPGFGPAFRTVYLGRGVIVEVDGVPQFVSQETEFLDFWKIENPYQC